MRSDRRRTLGMLKNIIDRNTKNEYLRKIETSKLFAEDLDYIRELIEAGLEKKPTFISKARRILSVLRRELK